MPWINSRGDVAHGVGGGYCNINNVQVAFGGVLGWWDDDTVAFCNGNDNWLVSLYHVPTKTTTRLDEQYGGPAGGMGANLGYCSNNKQAAWWFGTNTPGQAGLWSTVGLRAPAAGLMAMGPDGAIGYKPDYQSMGPTKVREIDGSEWTISLGSTDSLQLLGPGKAVWCEGLQPQAVGLPALTVAPGSHWMSHAAFCAGQWWFSCFHGTHGVILYPFNSYNGFSVLAKGDDWHNIRALSNTIIRVANSRGIGEQAGDIWVRDYDVVNKLVRDPWSANPVWMGAPVVDIRTINYVAPVPVAASITLDKTSGPAPLTVTGTLKQTGLKTWRWLLDDVIDQPIDGNTHVFTIANEGTHTIGLRGTGDGGAVAVTPQTVTVTAPAAVGEASITVDKTRGAVPLTIVASLTQKNLTTWRWTLDGNIDQPIDGNTHTFTITVPGDHSIGLRGSAPAGVIYATPIRVTALPKLDFIPGKKSVQAGFLEPIGNDASGTPVCAHLKSVNWDMVRIGAVDDPAQTQALVDEVTRQGMRPLVMVSKFEQVAIVPEWTDVELLNEPNLAGWSPAAYAAEVLKVVPIALQRNQRLWAGCVSNTSKGDLEWLRQVLALLPPEVCASLHRYPQNAGDTPDKPRADYATRAEEMAAVKAVVGTRKWGVSEFAYSMEPYNKPLTLWEKIKKFFGWKPPTYQFTEEQQAAYAKQEFNLWFAAGADFVTWYQVWEDDTPDVGLMRLDRTWKLVSEIFK